MKFTFSTKIMHLPVYDEAQMFEIFSGVVDAEDFADAKQKAQGRAWRRCQQLIRERGSIYGHDLNNMQLGISS